MAAGRKLLLVFLVCPVHDPMGGFGWGDHRAKGWMIMIRTTIIAALAAMLAATPAVANENFTADQLHRFCEVSDDFCVGFAAGLMNGMAIGRWTCVRR